MTEPLDGMGKSAMDPISVPQQQTSLDQHMSRGELVTAQQVSDFLLSNNYLLTALELLLESAEAGREAEVQPLAEVFSDRTRFPPEELANFEPADAVSMQKLARQREEELSVAEYDLRVAREDLQQLREAGGTSDVAKAFLVAASEEEEGCVGTAKGMEGKQGGWGGGGVLTPRDRLCLDAAVLEYLMRSGYRLSGTTFQEEVGVPLRKAAEQLGSGATLADYAAAFKHREEAEREAQAARERGAEQEALLVRVGELAGQLEDTQANNRRLEADLEYLRSKADSLQQQQEQLQRERDEALAAVQQAQQQAMQVAQQQVQAKGEAQDGGGMAGAAAGEEGAAARPWEGGAPDTNGEPGGQPSGSGRQPDEAGSSCPPTAGGAALPPEPGSAKVSTVSVQEMLGTVAATIPRLLPGVLVNTREQLVPLFTLTITDVAEPATREALAGRLFNMIRRPSPAQACSLADALAQVAQRIGPARAEQELVPHVIADVNSRHMERRALVAEACASLLPMLRGRGGGNDSGKGGQGGAAVLLMSLLQLTSDDEVEVRVTSAMRLAGVLLELESLEAYPQVEEVLLRLAADASADVTDAVTESLLPAILKWLRAGGGGTDGGTAPAQSCSSCSTPTAAAPSHDAAHSPSSNDLWQQQRGGLWHGAVAANGGGGGAGERGRNGAMPALPSPLLHERLLPALLGALREGLERCPYVAGTDSAVVQRGEAEQRALNEAHTRQVEVYLQMYLMTLPYVRHLAACTMPDWAKQAIAHLPVSSGRADRQVSSLRSVPHFQSGLSVAESSASEDEGNDTSPPALSLEKVLAAVAAPSAAKQQQVESDGSSAGTPIAAAAALAAEDDERADGTAAGRGEQAKPPTPSCGKLSAEKADSTAALGEAEVGQEASQAEASVAADGEAVADVRPADSMTGEQGAEVLGHSTGLCAPDELQLPNDMASPTRADDVAIEGDPGSSCHYSDEQLHAAMGAWVMHPDHAEWRMVEYMFQGALPVLLASLRAVPASDAGTTGLRRKYVATLRLTCGVLGQAFTQGAVEPLFLASSTAPDFRMLDRDSSHVADGAASLAPHTWEGTRVGRVAVLPMLLAAVLPCAGPGALAEFVRYVCMEEVKGKLWALEYEQDIMTALRFAAGFSDVQRMLIKVLWELTVKQTTPARRCAAAACRAVGPVFGVRQVTKHVLPVCVTLAGDSDSAVSGAAIRALVELYGAYGGGDQQQQQTGGSGGNIGGQSSDASGMVARVQAELEVLIPPGSHEVQLAALESLADGVPHYTPHQLEFVLKQVQWMVSTLHERTGTNVRGPSQLREMAGAILQCLRAVDACELLGEEVRLHHLTGLMALQHDKELLDGAQREMLAAMLRDRTSEAEPAAPQHQQQGMAQASPARSATAAAASPARGDGGHLGGVQTGRAEGRAAVSPSASPAHGATFSRMAQDFLQKRASSSISTPAGGQRRMGTMSSFFTEKAQSLKQRMENAAHDS